jgi:predicted small metal-binding protein
MIANNCNQCSCLIKISYHQKFMKTLACRDVGYNCDCILEGKTEEEVIKNGLEHAMEEHGMKPVDVTPQLKEKLRGLIHNS